MYFGSTESLPKLLDRHADIGKEWGGKGEEVARCPPGRAESRARFVSGHSLEWACTASSDSDKEEFVEKAHHDASQLGTSELRPELGSEIAGWKSEGGRGRLM